LWPSTLAPEQPFGPVTPQEQSSIELDEFASVFTAKDIDPNAVILRKC